MIPLTEMKIIQIDITNACINRCSNCTRLIGHHKKPFYMDMDTFKLAADSLVDFPGIVGMIGGEPLLHPDFEEMALYLASTRPDKKKRGLWSTIPEGNRYGALIKEVFGTQYFNDHTVNTIKHQPVLVAAREMISDEKKMWEFIDNCWVQRLWSATITPKGAYFCEVAAAFDMLFDGNRGWKIEPGWWHRTPEQFGEQKKHWCPKCGCAIPLERRTSTEGKDDISQGNLKALEGIGSPGVKKGRTILYNKGLSEEWHPDYNWYMSEIDKEEEKKYRKRIADRLCT
ncbi:Radical SAM domain protein [Desulfamplus magnetovallimortis]|uniref:Radical SAM domain protein n=1 Tax=Desulfamplus magnetovallimortis TaxID=1246637 RepID=A0A1W1HFC5_9BACT|nr:radical SAM protein [Desulfamplus magnetovallimortis]SLM31187.1 Radical SAM domain protein [Desulfamplus magnetovallimortis]